MSDPVTNVEIEDVLSSIRRLVSDGDKARDRGFQDKDAASQQAQEPQADEAEATLDEKSSDEADKPDKFVLTPALLVAQDDAAAEGAEDDAADDDDWSEEAWAVTEPASEEAVNDEADTSDWDAEFQREDQQDSGITEEAGTPVDEQAEEVEAADHGADDDSIEDGPIQLTNMVFDSAPAEDASAVDTTATDRSDLVATIAELEAAVSGDTSEFEPDGSEVEDETSSQPIPWPGAVARFAHPSEDATDTEEDTASDASTGDAESAAAAVEDAEVEDTAPDASAEEMPTFTHRSAESAEDEGGAEDVSTDEDDLDGLLATEGVTIDEEALRDLVGQVVREELTGPLGERITRNVRKLVRREIYRILSSQEFD
ncbi:MAG: hypothetical protein AAGL89_01695 [Pseudomonadota bacterium]